MQSKTRVRNPGLSPLTTSSYSPAEERLNAASHGLGVILGMAGLVMMLVASAQDSVRLTSSAVYGASIILLFLASTIYHSVSLPKLKAILKTLDHCAIYLLIAGTYTPFMTISLASKGGLFYLLFIWTIAIAGIVFKIFWGHRFPKIGLTSYLLMGWFIVITGPEMLSSLAPNGLLLLAAGGLSYTLGSIFYVWKKLAFNHAIWHLFVLAGAILHFLSIYWYVLPANMSG